MDEIGLATILRGTSGFLPSQAEVKHLLTDTDWASVAARLSNAGFPEVVIKLGSGGALLHDSNTGISIKLPPAAASPQDLTGAGDAFCGAYTACRGIGFSPQDSAMRANVAAAMVIECVGAEEALRLLPDIAQNRLSIYAASVVTS